MNKAVFFDRDGTLIEEKNYINNPNDVVIIDGVEEVFSHFHELGYKIIIISNQAGIARGLVSEEQYLSVDKKMKELLRNGHLIEQSYFCPHHPDFSGSCSCRKPNIGMLEDAQLKFNIDLTKSIVVGDKMSDVKLVETANLLRGYFVQTGHGKDESSLGEKIPDKVKIINSIKDILIIETNLMENK